MIMLVKEQTSAQDVEIDICLCMYIGTSRMWCLRMWLSTLLDLCVSSLRRGRANLLCIVSKFNG